VTDVHKVTLQIRPPRGSDPGRVEEAWYCVADGCVVLTDADGKPIGGEKCHLSPGDDARLIACRMLRARRHSSAVSGFNDRLAFPQLKF
jgi:hypothetical protein